MSNQMETKIISKDKFLTQNSEKSEVNGNKKYQVTTNVIARKGIPYSTYFTVIMLDGKEREVGRRTRWITDFSNEPKNYTLVFTTSPETKFIILGYRINIETPVKSEVEISLQNPSSLIVKEADNENETFDDITKFTIPKLPTLSKDEELILEKKIVWLCAAPRSGTTWLGTRLLNHIDNIVWHEPWIGLHLGLFRVALMPAIDFGKTSYKYERILDQQASNGEYFFSPHHKNNWLPFLRKLILARTYSHAQTLTKNIIIKDPVGSNGTDLLSEALPLSKIIFLIRDGRDEVDSRIDMHRPNSWVEFKSLSTQEERVHAIEFYSKFWTVNINNISKGFQAHKNDLKLLVKYEDLLQDTFSELKKIYDFINVPISDEELKRTIELYDFKNIPESDKGQGKFNRSATPGGWKNNFSKDEQELMNSIMEKTLKEMGYP